MTDAALYIVGAALTVALASFISYSGGEDKWQKFALGAILLAMLASGAKEALGAASGGLFSPPEQEGSASTMREDIAKESFEGGIARLVANELSCPVSLVRVTAVGFVFENMSAEKITVYLYGEAALGDYRGVRGLLSECGFGECEVVLSFEKNGT